jgi:tetratricopeptide (TPR) repeat protein
LEEELGKEMSISEELERAEKWCEDVLLPTNLNSLWYERMGETAKAQAEYRLAISKFTRATELENPNLGCFKGLAESYYENDELLSACSSMEKALTLVKAAESPDTEEITRIYLRLANWYTQLQQPDRALTYYEQAIEVSPDNQDALSGILTIRIDSGPEEKTRDLIVSTNKPAPEESGFSRLALTLLNEAEDYSYGSPIRSLIRICSARQDSMTALLDAMDQAITLARAQKLDFKLQVLLLHRGVAAIHNNNQNEEASLQAVSLWTNCYDNTDKIARHNYDNGVQWNDSLYFAIIHQLSLHYFEQSIKQQAAPDILSKLVNLRQCFRFPGISGITAADTNLAMYYARRGDRAAAKEQVKQYVRIAIDDLSDDTDENDYWAAYRLSQCLLASGDDLNAITAWSLLEPIETDVVTKALKLEGGPKKSFIVEINEFVKTKCPLGATQMDRIKVVQEELETRMAVLSQEADETGNSEAKEDVQKALTVLQSALTSKENFTNGVTGETPITRLDRTDIANEFQFTCDGTCGASWDFDHALNPCKYCWELGFCDDCLSLLKGGNLKKIICSPNHEWLAVPKYSPRGNMAAREGTVQVRGELVNGVRVGGEKVSVKDWIASLKDDWAL